jgi:FtsZ-interacting cell division protein ZipA
LDLPKVPQEMSPFKTMLNDAHLLAESLNGHLVDDAGRLLVDDAVSAIQAQLDQIYQSMFQHGIAAGSSTASRLFS